ncbi:hypothetical protein [Bradyrhizobium genosp. P]|uniref:hypothetical protein n=1 Tax=Bradyrhizobium genosp. P TaxID=83641 RepID=UPI003CF3310B
MDWIDNPWEQAERAERLARTALDPLTVERLLAFADDCRRQIAATERETRGGLLATLPAA